MIQIDMEMPKSCYDCPLAMLRYTTLFRNGKQATNQYACVITGKVITSTKRNRFCPLMDAVPVVRCKDCKHNAKSGGTCDHICIDADDNWFCADGERMMG